MSLIENMDLIIVVLYKQKVSESNTLMTLLNCKNDFSEKVIFVWDNSPMPLEQSEIFLLENQFKNFKYLNCKSNKSLSEVYNTVIKSNKFNKVFILDQDTILTEDYFELMDYASNNNADIGLFLPFVKNKKKIISPLDYNVINFHHSGNIKKCKTIAKNKTAFASGLCIKEWVFKRDNIWFDENLNFYGIDYKFVLDYGDRNVNMYIIDHELHHNLSFTEKEVKEVKVRRFESGIFAAFYLANLRFNFFEKIIVVARFFLVASKMALTYKSIAFYKIFFKSLRSLI